MKTKLTECDAYKDGGTIEYCDENNNRYFVDGRIRSKTKGELFDRYPSDKGAKILDQNNFEIEDPLIEKIKRMIQ
jgi:hypothetical protein